MSNAPLRPTPELIAEVSAIAGRPVTRHDVALAVRHFLRGVDFAHPHEAREVASRRDLLQCRDLLLPLIIDPAVVPRDVAAYISLQRWLPCFFVKEQRPENPHGPPAPDDLPNLDSDGEVPADVPWPWEGGPSFEAAPPPTVPGAGGGRSSSGPRKRRSVGFSVVRRTSAVAGVDLASWAAALDLRAVTMHVALFITCEVTAALAVVLATDTCTHLVCGTVAASDTLTPHLGRFPKLQRYADSCWVAGARRPKNPSRATYHRPEPTPLSDVCSVPPLTIPHTVRDLSVSVPHTDHAVVGPVLTHLYVAFPRLVADLSRHLTSLTVHCHTYSLAKVSDEYFAVLSKCLSLRRLDVLNSGFGIIGATAIKALPRLEHACLCSTSITDPCIPVLAESPSITHLDVSGNRVHNLSPLKTLRTLKEVVVYWCDGHTRALRDVFPKRGPVRLLCVDLDWSDDSADDVDYDGEVQEAAPQ